VLLDIDVHKLEAWGYLSYNWLLNTYSTVDRETAPDEMTTWTMTTPGKGLHLLFKRPADFPSTEDFKKAELAPGVELIAYGQTPLPPTVKHEKDKTGKKTKVGAYTWVKEDYSETKCHSAWDEHFTFPYDAMRDMKTDVTFDVELRPERVNLAPLPDWLTLFAYDHKTPLMSYRDYQNALNPHMPEYWAFRYGNDTRRFYQELDALKTKYGIPSAYLTTEEWNALYDRYQRVTLAELKRRTVRGLPLRTPRR
jgi:hypothetical protein